MSLKQVKAYHDPELSQKFLRKITDRSQKPIRLMEVCGTHTVSIFKSGIRTLLPDTIHLLSGPGCPVCVTAQNEIDAFIALSKEKDTIVTTFGDLIRVPGTGSSLQKEKADGADVRIVYSTMDALEIAKKNPGKKVVFLGVGFETTAPTIAAAIMTADDLHLDNFFVAPAHKTVPEALTALVSSRATNIDGFLLPGHVSVIIGLDAYQPFFDQFQIPCAIAGFEPTDLLYGISMLVEQIESKKPALENAYPRAVTNEGNQRAVQVIDTVFKKADADWRGIGTISGSGLDIRERYAAFDAKKAFNLTLQPAVEPKGCACGEILTGVKTPVECPLYKTKCTPVSPVGPCMVSSEGTCAAYYRYHG